MKRMNIYLLTMLWVLGVTVAVMLLCYILSGFDTSALVLVSILWGIPAVPYLLFITCSFMFGLKGTEHLYWAVGSLFAYGVLTYLLLPSCQVAADPQIIHATLKLVTFFAIAFGCGCLWRLGMGHSSIWLGGAKVFVSLCAGAVLGYIMLANLNEMGGLNDKYWAQEQYNDDKTLFYEARMHFSPFPARVVGVRYFNKYGRYAGGSASQPCNYQLQDIRLGETPDGSADILLYKHYERIVTDLLADCKDAFRKESGNTTTYLFYKNDTLCRMETERYENGILSKICRFESISGNNYDVVERFDELGVPQEMFRNSSPFLRLWRIYYFQVEAEVPRFNYGYDDPENPNLDERLRRLLESGVPFEQDCDSLE